VQVLGRAYQGRTFIGARQQFWRDSLHSTTNDSYGYQQQLNPGLRGAIRSHQPLSQGFSTTTTSSTPTMTKGSHEVIPVVNGRISLGNVEVNSLTII